MDLKQAIRDTIKEIEAGGDSPSAILGVTPQMIGAIKKGKGTFTFELAEKFFSIMEVAEVEPDTNAPPEAETDPDVIENGEIEVIEEPPPAPPASGHAAPSAPMTVPPGVRPGSASPVVIPPRVGPVVRQNDVQKVDQPLVSGAIPASGVQVAQIVAAVLQAMGHAPATAEPEPMGGRITVGPEVQGNASDRLPKTFGAGWNRSHKEVQAEREAQRSTPTRKLVLRRGQ